MKKKKVASENIQMTKKEREALQAQLEKEHEVRERLELVNTLVLRVSSFDGCERVNQLEMLR